MNDVLVQSILGFTLDARKVLEREADEQLQGIYGWLPDGTFTRADRMPAIAQLEEAKETRAQLERFKDDEATAGMDAKTARKKLLREAAFTWLNRLVAFRMMEERRLLKKTISQLMTSPAYLFWLADDKDPEARELHDAGEVPANPMGEGPRHIAYRHFLLWQCDEQSRDVSILFDPSTLSSRLCPRPPILKQLVEAMNVEGLDEAWRAGNEETIGWVYQGFSSEELKAAFAAARESKRKFEPEDIPAVTQLFTIRWVVRYLVENTLGRIWVEMHPDSRLTDSLGYLVPAKCPQHRALRPVKDITFLDPCCGSMHFGLLAFDLFAEMYREERENAGKPGWPATPSAATEEEIPELILARNIHGIDIDTRAVQLSALTLVLKARMLNPEARVTDANLASANVEQITGGQLDEFISKTQFSHPIYERILRRLADRVKDSPHLGSLLRLEKGIQQLVDAERKRSSELLDQLPGLHPEQFDTEEGVEEFFDILTVQILRHLDHFVQSAHAAGQHAGLFAREAAKGLRFLSLIDQRYDVIATNPPYLSGRKMNKRLATLMEQEYEEGKGDLYAAFIMRCQELLAPEGLMGMLTMHSFMFISSYENLRSRLRKEVAIETLAHFGGGLFAVGNPGTLQTVAFVLRREPETKRREGQVGTYFRLIKERDAEAKRLAIESALVALRQGGDHPKLFHYKQSDFDAIPDKPWMYWITPRIRSQFSNARFIRDVARPRVGLQTGDNQRFLRHWWEIGLERIGLTCRDRDAAASSGKKWFPYNKGGSPVPWYRPQDNVVIWAEDGAQINAFRPRAVIRNPEFYFRKGVTWSDVSSKGFAARISPGGFIHDVKGMTCYPDTEDMQSILGILNSRFAKFVLAGLNPTISFQIGDIERLPVPRDRCPKIKDLVNRCVILARQSGCESETTYDFIEPLLAITDRTTRKEQLATLEAEIDAEVSRLYDLREEDLVAIDCELRGPAASSSNDDAVEEPGSSDDDETAGDLCPADWARSWLSYAIGTVLRRFEIGKSGGLGCGNFQATTATALCALIDPDGIMPCDNGHPQDIADRAVNCLTLMLGVTRARDVIRTTTDEACDPIEAVRGWLDRFTGTPDKSFWRYHFQLYRSRPVYWPLQSPRKKYTIWVFQEKFDKNTLFTVRGLVEERLRLLDREITDKRVAAGNNRRLAKQVDKLLEMADDLREFSKRIKEIIDHGYTPHIDDGVLLNAAPLHTLLPSWQETKEAWTKLEAGEYDWAQQAMEYWPERVKSACKNNKSFAIAHGLA